MKTNVYDLVALLTIMLITALLLGARVDQEKRELQKQVTRNEACVRGVAAGDGGAVVLTCDPAIAETYAVAHRGQPLMLDTD